MAPTTSTAQYPVLAPPRYRRGRTRTRTERALTVIADLGALIRPGLIGWPAAIVLAVIAAAVAIPRAGDLAVIVVVAAVLAAAGLLTWRAAR